MRSPTRNEANLGTQEVRPAVDLLDAAWRGLASPGFATALAAVGTLFLLVAACTPQAPVSASADPTAYAAWVASLPTWWQPRVPALERVGLTHLFRTPLFRLYLTLVGVHLALMAVQRAGDALRAWRMARRRQQGGARPVEPAPPAAALREGGWLTVARGRRGQALCTWLWRPPWEVLAYLGALALLAGGVWSARAAWSIRPLPLAPGQAATLPFGQQGLQVRLERLWASDPSGSFHVAQISFSDPDTGELLGGGVARAGVPLRARGVWLYLTEVSPLVTVQARDKAGQRLGIQGFPAGAADETDVHLYFGEGRQEQTFAVPARRLSARMVQVDGQVRYRLELYQGSEARPRLTAEVSESGILSTEDLDLYFLLGEYAWFAPRRNAGAWAVVCGLGLILAGAGALGQGFGFLLVREEGGQGAARLGAPTGKAGWSQGAVERFARWALARGADGTLRWAWMVDVALLLVGLAGALLLPWEVAAADLPPEHAPAWVLLRAIPLLAGWAGLACSLFPALVALRQVPGAEPWATRLQEAGLRWLVAGLATGAIASWLHTGSFWAGGLWQAWPAALWLLGLGSQFAGWARTESVWSRRFGVFLGAAAWVLAVAAAVGKAPT